MRGSRPFRTAGGFTLVHVQPFKGGVTASRIVASAEKERSPAEPPAGESSCHGKPITPAQRPSETYGSVLRPADRPCPFRQWDQGTACLRGAEAQHHHCRERQHIGRGYRRGLTLRWFAQWFRPCRATDRSISQPRMPTGLPNSSACRSPASPGTLYRKQGKMSRGLKNRTTIAFRPITHQCRSWVISGPRRAQTRSPLYRGERT